MPGPSIMEGDSFIERLDAAVARHLGPGWGVDSPQRLTGGAASITWRFDACRNGERKSLVLRLSRSGNRMSTGLKKPVEAEVLKVAVASGVAAPTVVFTLDHRDELGEGFAMEYIAGETIPRKILREELFGSVRAGLASQCGRVLAAIHRTDASAVTGLPTQDACSQLQQCESLYRSAGEHLPVFELALRWLERRLPNRPTQALVHGDFRNGNILVTPEHGIRAVLDWELSHLGDGLEDLGWLCVNSWRFGNRDQPVGGFGERRDLYAAYKEASGTDVDEEVVRFWEVFGTLRWGIICLYLGSAHPDGGRRSVEHAAIGRRVSETEIDLLQLV